MRPAAFPPERGAFLLLEPRRIVSLPRNAVATIEFEDPSRDVVEEIIVGHRNDGAWVLLEVSLEPGHRFSVEMIRQLFEQQYRASTAATGTMRRAGVRRRTAATPCFPRAADGAHPRRLRVAFQLWPSTLTGRLRAWPVRRGACRIAIRLGLGTTPARDGRARPSALGRCLRRCVARPRGDRVAVPAAAAHLDAGLRTGFAFDSVSVPAMIRSSVDLPEPFRPSTPIFAPGKRTARFAEDVAFRRHHLADAIHRVDVLGHAC